MEVSGSLPRTPPSTPPRYTLGVDGAWALHAPSFLASGYGRVDGVGRNSLVLVVRLDSPLCSFFTTDAHTWGVDTPSESPCAYATSNTV